MKKFPLILGLLFLNGWGLWWVSPIRQHSAAFAQSEPEKTSTTTQNKIEQTNPEVTRLQEAAALAFAEMYHPELSELLHQLKKAQPKAYAKAIRDLYSTMTKLETLRERSPHRYDHALEMWQLESRIRLVSARMTKSSKPELEKQLKTLLGQRLDLKLKQSLLEKKRLEERLQKLTTTIDNLEQNREVELERDFHRIQRELGLGPKPPRPDKP